MTQEHEIAEWRRKYGNALTILCVVVLMALWFWGVGYTDPDSFNR